MTGAIIPTIGATRTTPEHYLSRLPYLLKPVVPNGHFGAPQGAPFLCPARPAPGKLAPVILSFRPDVFFLAPKFRAAHRHPHRSRWGANGRRRQDQQAGALFPPVPAARRPAADPAGKGALGRCRGFPSPPSPLAGRPVAAHSGGAGAGCRHRTAAAWRSA